MMNENLADFFVISELAETVQIGPIGSEVTILAYFDNAHISERDMTAGAKHHYDFNLSTVQPFLTCMETDVSHLEGGDRAVVNGVEYTIADTQPDGNGLVKLLLYKK